MYCNPIEAFAVIFNCEGLSWGAHFWVYWAAPLIGAYAAQLIGMEMERPHPHTPSQLYLRAQLAILA